MSTEIIVALIGLGGSALGSVIGIFINTKLSNYRIEQLEKKLTSITTSSKELIKSSRI